MPLSEQAQAIREQVLQCLTKELTVDVTCEHVQGAGGQSQVKVRMSLCLRSLNAEIATAYDTFST